MLGYACVRNRFQGGGHPLVQTPLAPDPRSVPLVSAGLPAASSRQRTYAILALVCAGLLASDVGEQFPECRSSWSKIGLTPRTGDTYRRHTLAETTPSLVGRVS
ncbi:hypothetical protein GCM10018952_22770 [Streptosporangium vulgare]